MTQTSTIQEFPKTVAGRTQRPWGPHVARRLYGWDPCSKPVVRKHFYISYPFIEQDYQIFPQYTQCCSFTKNTKLTNCCSLEWFIKIYIGCNVWFNKFSHLEDEIYPPGVTLPPDKNHCSLPCPWCPCLSGSQRLSWFWGSLASSIATFLDSSRNRSICRLLRWSPAQLMSCSLVNVSFLA